MQIISTADSAFLTEVEELLQTQGEILVEMRSSRMAGSRDVVLFHSLATFREKLASLPPAAMVDVYRSYSLPLRGTITEEFVQRAQAELAGAAEYLIVYLQSPHPGRFFSFQDGEGTAEMEKDLRDTLGEQAAVGTYPDYLEKSGNRLWAVVPEANGSVSIGVY